MNDALFLAINAGSNPPPLVLELARLIAVWAVPAAIMLFLALWVRGKTETRGALITATLVMVLGLIVNFLIGLAYFHPRPFMEGLGRQYLAHAPNSSFPSDHATFLWSLGFALIVLGRLRVWAGLLLAAGLAVAWARVYLGVHFPFDMLGSLIVSLLISSSARPLEGAIGERILPMAQGTYDALITACRLPSALFPRGSDRPRRVVH
ncbi:MAG: undecaprenyl-diphosphatase [Acetobacteraceae bacterium]